jgi:hypothetical protein
MGYIGNGVGRAVSNGTRSCALIQGESMLNTRGSQASWAIGKWTRSLGATGLTLALFASASMIAAPSAMAEEECSKVSGEAVYLMEGERQRVSDYLSTDLESRPQRFNFYWSNGEEHLELTELTSASCTINSTGGKKFKGEGTATLNGEPGYTVKFTIFVSNKGANSVVVHIYEGKEKLYSFHDAARTGETIS